MNRLLSITLVCLLQVSMAVASAFNLSVEVTPNGSGSLSTSGGTYEEGSSVYLWTYANTGYVFKGWYEGETLLSSSTSFTYTMPSKDVLVQARYEYDPTVPGNPVMPDTTTYYQFSATVSPQGAGSLNTTSGRYAAGATVYLYTYPHTGYRFIGWQNGQGETVSSSSSFNYTMPRHDSQLTALYLYDPDVPANPDSMATQYTVTVACKPFGGGSFNTTSATIAEGASVHLYAYTHTGYDFLRWENEAGEVLSTEQGFYYVIPHGNTTVYGVFEFNPQNPGNPGKNYWNKELGEVIVDDFTPGRLNEAVSSAIAGSDRSEVTMITVAGRMSDYDFGIANDYPNCTLLDLSRVTGITQVPSYAFDYTGLETVSLPSTVESIGYRAFAECQKLVALNVYAMTPPKLEDGVFAGIPEGLTVYVPAASVAQYQDAEGWKNFTILPIQDDVRSITVSLPDGADAADYAQMWLELTNTKNGQKLHYVMTDRTYYTFANIIRNTTWNIVVRNERGDVFGQIGNVEVKDDDVSVTFASLSKPQNVMLSVLTPEGKDVTGQVQVTWTDAQGNYLAQGASVSGLPAGYQLHYRIVLSQEPSMTYETPAAAEYVLKDGGNAITCQLQTIRQVRLSGKVKDATTGLPLGGAVVSASQTFGGKYSKTLTAKTDNQGLFALEVADVPTSVAFAASDYVSQTLDFSDNEFEGITDFSVPDVSLKSITGATITLGFTYTSCEGDKQEWYSDYQNVSYQLFNVTRNQVVSQFNVQYPQIVLMEEIADGDVLRLSAASRTDAFTPVETTVTIAEQKAQATFDIVELGKIRSSFKANGNAAVVGSLYDAAGKLVTTQNYSGASLTISGLADGRYTLVTMGSSRLFNTIYDLSKLPQTGLAEGADYVLSSVGVKSGTVSLVSIEEVPTLNESKLYYTGNNTSFTVNKPSIVAGNYLTFTGRIDFKPAYATSVSNVQLIVDLPASCEFVENSVMVGNITSSYTLNGHQITIPMTRYTDRVRFCVVPTLGGDYAPSAFARFDLNGVTVTQPIGSANYTAKNLSISVPSTVAKTAIPVSGTAIGKSLVEIYDGDVLIGQTTSLANGNWATTCELNEPYNLTRHHIMAKVTTAQGLVLQSGNIDCFYDKNAIQVSKVMMYHENPELHKTYALTFDFQKPMDKDENYIYYIYNRMFTFTIDFTNNDPEAVSDVILYVKTAQSGWHPLSANYDAKQGLWVAAGEFGNMYDGDLPVNVSVDYTCRTEQYIDSERIAEATTAVSDIVTGFSDNSKSINDFFDSNETITTEDYIRLCQQLGLPIDPKELGFDTTFSADGMTDAEIEAYLDSAQTDFETRYAQMLEMADRYAQSFNMDNVYGQLQENGYTMTIEKADGLNEEELPKLGYTPMPLDDGSHLYMRTTDEGVDYVNFKMNVHIRILFPADAARAFRALRKAPLTDDFKEAFKKIDIAKQTVMSLIEDFQKRLMLPVATLEKQIKELERDIKEINRYINCMCKEGSDSQKFWMKRLKDAEHTLAITKTALKWARPLLRFLARAIPVADYLATLKECYDISSELADIYLSIPDPCPNDQTNANWCKAQDITILIATATFAIADVVAEVTADMEIAGGAAASIASGGTSLAVTGWGIVQKVLAQLGKYALTTATKYFGIKQLRKNVAALRCKEKDSEPTPDGPGQPSGNPDKKFGIDPSGFVYEGVFSNRVEGVTATIYYKEDVEDMYGDLHENIVKWDAEEYAQENPLFTDENGFYRWDVPNGLWQVKFEKEGYETTYSEWLPVPPPQLDINIAMKQNVQPNVRQARAFESAVEVEFDKYMMPELLTAENIMVVADGLPVEGTVELLNEETSYEGSSETFASKVRFNAAQPFSTAEVTLMVSSRVKSYAGIRMQDDYSQTFAVEHEIRQIVCDSSAVVVYGRPAVLTVKVLPALASAGKTLRVQTSSTMILGVETEQVTIGADGKAEIAVNGQLPGMAALMFSVEGYDLTASTIVHVEQLTDVMAATPVASIASGSVVEKGIAVTLSCETEGATIYYTLDGSCPCDDTGSRMVYDGTPIVINETTTIKVMAVAPGMYDSDVAEFTYVVNGIDGIADASGSAQVTLWPLPMSDRLNVSAGGETVRSVVVSSLNGVTVASEGKPASEVSLDVSTLPTGIYIVSVAVGDGTFSRKVMKKD